MELERLAQKARQGHNTAERYRVESEDEKKLRLILMERLKLPSDIQADYDSLIGVENVKAWGDKAMGRNRKSFINLKEVRTALLYGNPGNGKSVVMRALAKRHGWNMIVIAPGDLSSKWIGESEKLGRMLFKIALENTPVVVLFEEIDGLMRKRQKASESAQTQIASLLVAWDEVLESKSQDLIIAATSNFPDTLDAAIYRRFIRQLKVADPTESQIKLLLGKFFDDVGIKSSLTAQELRDIAAKCKRYSFTDVIQLGRYAATLLENSFCELHFDKLKELPPLTVEQVELAQSLLTPTILLAEREECNNEDQRKKKTMTERLESFYPAAEKTSLLLDIRPETGNERCLHCRPQPLKKDSCGCGVKLHNTATTSSITQAKPIPRNYTGSYY